MSGRMTPIDAIHSMETLFFLISLISVSRPAINISKITPISAVSARKLVSVTTPRTDGPKMTPATSAPTTWGMLTFSERPPRNFVDKMIMATAKRK